MTSASEIVRAEGHLVDSQVLNAIFDKVIEHKSSFEVQQFDIGRTNDEVSNITLKITAPDEPVLMQLLEDLLPLGCHPVRERDAALESAPQDGCAPDDFYSTTNLRTQIRIAGHWLDVARQRMDATIVVEGDRIVCLKLRELRKGDMVVCGLDGIKVVPEFCERDRFGFTFMANDISSERRVEVSVSKIAALMGEVKASGKRIAFVAGPVIVHTGGVDYFCELIRRDYVDVLLAGNALAVHDVEYALYGTSLGVDLEAGAPVEHGHKHHMHAINTINRTGGLRPAVERGVLQSGIFYEVVRRDVEYVLAGSIRDDGPLVDTVMDLVDAQNRYAAALADVGLVIVLSTMLHGIGVGNMLPAWTRVACVDINPAVVTKLADRGSAQTIGLVTDVGLFLHQLVRKISDGPR